MTPTILAIDPGPAESAWVIWNGETIAAFGKNDNDTVLGICWDAEKAYGASLLAIEQIRSYGMPVGQEVFDACTWYGRFIEAWLRTQEALDKSKYVRDASVMLIPRQDVRLHHCHSIKANDGTVRMALMDRLGGKGTKKKPGVTYGISKDVWSALALAIHVSDMEGQAKLDRMPVGGLREQSA